MGLLDNINTGDLADKAKSLINENQEKVDQGIEKTGGKFSDKVDQGQSFLEDNTGNP